MCKCAHAQGSVHVFVSKNCKLYMCHICRKTTDKNMCTCSETDGLDRVCDPGCLRKKSKFVRAEGWGCKCRVVIHTVCTVHILYLQHMNTEHVYWGNLPKKLLLKLNWWTSLSQHRAGRYNQFKRWTGDDGLAGGSLGNGVHWKSGDWKVRCQSRQSEVTLAHKITQVTKSSGKQQKTGKQEKKCVKALT